MQWCELGVWHVIGAKLRLVRSSFLTSDHGYRILVRRGTGEPNRAGNITYPSGGTHRKSLGKGTSARWEPAPELQRIHLSIWSIEAQDREEMTKLFLL